jgi:hypothetical protein
MFLIATLAVLMLALWKRYSLPRVLVGLAAIWIAFALLTIMIPFSAFVVLALGLLVASVVWSALLFSARMRVRFASAVESFDGVASLMLLDTVLGSVVLCYDKLARLRAEGNIHGWYVPAIEAVPVFGCLVIAILLVAPWFKRPAPNGRTKGMVGTACQWIKKMLVRGGKDEPVIPSRELGSLDREILLVVYDGLRQESLKHRESIREAFAWWVVGFLAIATGILAADSERVGRCSTPIYILLAGAGILLVYHVMRQRELAEEAFGSMRKIEQLFRLHDDGAYIKGKAILPGSYSGERARMILGLTGGDWPLVLAVTLLLAVDAALVHGCSIG